MVLVSKQSVPVIEYILVWLRLAHMKKWACPEPSDIPPCKHAIEATCCSLFAWSRTLLVRWLVEPVSQAEQETRWRRFKVHDAKAPHVCVMLHYKLNFPFHCATLSTKVQHPRNKTHRLEEGTVFGKGGTNFGNQKLSVGTNLAAKSSLGGPLLAVPCYIYAVYTRTNGPLKDTKVTCLNFGSGPSAP